MSGKGKIRFFWKVCVTLLLFGTSGVSYAVAPTGSCPVGHAHMGHGGGPRTETHTHAGSGASARGAQLADAECSSCHGEDGISTADDVPNLAGQEFYYLCAALDVCRQQGKKCKDHEDIAESLSDQDILDLAEFYADLPSKNW